MTYAKKFEKEIIKILCGSHLPNELIDEVLGEKSFDYEMEEGSGYFVSFKNSRLPEEQVTYHEPVVIGEWNGIESGFIVFLLDKELTLECHGWGEFNIPKDYREQDVNVYQK